MKEEFGSNMRDLYKWMSHHLISCRTIQAAIREGKLSTQQIMNWVERNQLLLANEIELVLMMKNFQSTSLILPSEKVFREEVTASLQRLIPSYEIMVREIGKGVA
ncbi:hypothetical protein RB620_24675 [Paenibacillus sp. LHD-117]|uniref:hypothetical protein n=1 Tax=Paenibacillus sp. LHD-117 TaxID=3071412 RepID=UPI0027E0E065|nr:hypothetical protein [Paenibacillus sp. LHD-117]MDQ6422632.1 hypothetical protein [Paenibacillus sp. LHD-117]